MITKEYERTATRLLRGMPKSKPYFKLVDGIRQYGHRGTHKTKQAVKWQRFWRLKRFTSSKVSRFDNKWMFMYNACIL